MKNIWLVLIITIGLSFRIFGLSNHPTGFTPDEASFGYDAYSILKTGKDQWGKALPLTLQSFGDSKLPLYTYLAIPSVAIFGLNEFSTRLPNALVGVLAIWATYLLTKKLFFKNEAVALTGSLLLAVSPWHIALSRGAFEANLTVFFMSMGVWTFLTKKYFLSSLFFGLNLFSYHSARLVTPLIIAFLVFQNKKVFDFRKNILSILVFAVFFGVAVWQVLNGGSSRAADITIFNPTDKWMAVYDKRYEAVFDGLPNTVAKIFSNKLTYIFKEFTNSYFTYLSPQFLFTTGPSETTYGMLTGHGVLYLFEFLFVTTAIVYLIREGYKDKSLRFIIFWILISIIPASLTKGSGFAGNRASVMMPAIQIFSAIGATFLFNFLAKKLKRNLVIGAYILTFFVSLIFFLEGYFYKQPREGASGMLFGRREMMKEIQKIENNYDQIIMSRSLSEPQIYVAFYGLYDPTEYQKETKDWHRFKQEGKSFLDQLGEYHLGKYTFRNIAFNEDSMIPNVLMVGKPEEYTGKIDPLHIVAYKNSFPAIIIYDPAQDVKSD